MGFRSCYQRAACREGRSSALCLVSHEWLPSPLADCDQSGPTIQVSPVGRRPASAGEQLEARDKLRRRIGNASRPDPRVPQRPCVREAADALRRRPANATTWLEEEAPAFRLDAAAHTIVSKSAARSICAANP